MHQKCLSYEMIPKLPDVGCGILRGGAFIWRFYGICKVRNLCFGSFRIVLLT